MTVSVREVGADEVERLSRLTVDAFVGLPDAVYEEGYLDELADVARRAEEAVVLVAVDDENGDLLGGITYVDTPGRWSSGDLDGEAELRMLAVAATAQGKGVAGRLVDACIARARAAGKRAHPPAHHGVDGGRPAGLPAGRFPTDPGERHPADARPRVDRLRPRPRGLAWAPSPGGGTGQTRRA